MTRWLIIIALDLAASFAALLLAPFVVPFADKYSGRLPRAFAWMETPDNRLPGDLREPMVRWVYEHLGWRVCAAYWLMRNRAYRFSLRFAYWPRAYMHADGQMRVDGYCEGEIRTGDDVGDREGTVRFFSADAWEFYQVRRLFADFGYRIRFGWKLAPFFRTDFAQWPDEPEKSAWGMPVAHVSLRRIKSERVK